MKRFFAVLLAVIMTAAMLMLAGCALTDEKPADQDTDSELDMTAVVAQAGDEVVTMADYKDMFDMSVEYYTQMGYSFTDPQMVQQLQDLVIDSLLSRAVVIQQAKLSGMDKLTDEESVALEEQCDQSVNDMLDYYRTQAEQEKAADDSVDVEARIVELVEEESAHYASGITTYDEYIEWIREQERDNFLYNKMQESVYADISVSDEEIATWMTDKIAEVGTAYEDDPGLYKDNQEEFERNGGTPVVTAPEGYSRMYHIFVTNEEALPEEYDTNTARMTEIESEYGEKAFEDAVAGTSAHKDELAALVTEYAELKTKNDTLLDEHLADARVTADEAYAKLEGGADFAEVMGEYTQDVEFTQYDAFATKGMLISTEHESGTDWSAVVKEEFAKLAPGQYSGVFRDDDGYHIIYYVSDEPSGDRAAADFETEIRELILAQKQTDEWNTLISEWLGDKSVVRNEELIRLLGQ